MAAQARAVPAVRLPLLLEPQPEGGYTVTSPLVPELVTEGDTLEEALMNVQDAWEAVLGLYEDDGRPLPVGLSLDVMDGPIALHVMALPAGVGSRLVLLTDEGCRDVSMPMTAEHRLWRNDATGRDAVIPDLGEKDLKMGTVQAVVRQLGLDWQEFLNGRSD